MHLPNCQFCLRSNHVTLPKNFNKTIQFHGTFHGLKITNCLDNLDNISLLLDEDDNLEEKLLIY